MAAATSAVTMVASATDVASVTTSAYTPLYDDLLVLLVGATGFTGQPQQMVVTNSVAGLPGFVPVCRAQLNGSADLVCAFVGSAKQGFRQNASRTTTIAFAGITVTGTFWGVYRIAGMARVGLGAVRQFALQENAAAATPAPVFSAACLTENPVVGILGNGTNPATMTPPTSFTETIDTGIATPVAGFEVIFRNNGFTGSTLTWGSASASAFGALALEMNTSGLTGSDMSLIELGWNGA